MRKSGFVLAAAAALSACNGLGGNGGDGGQGLAAVQPSQIDPQRLRAAVTDDEARSFYEQRQWQPAWDSDKAQALIATIEGSGRHGLSARIFLDDLGQARTPEAREAAMTRAALAYAGALARGLVDPTRVHEIYELPRPEFDAPVALAAALEDGDLATWFDGLAPQDPEYQALSRAFVEASQAMAGEPRPPIPSGDLIRPGDRDPRMAAIAAALRAEGALAPAQGGTPAAAAEPTVYSSDLVAAVRRLQQDHGLESAGIIGDQTLELLNRGPADRVRTLAVNLERRRWLVRPSPSTRIDVNIADATLSYWRDGRLADRRPVVVGEPENETPALASPIFRLAANPTWTVPESIQKEEIEPKGAAYMARNNMRWENGRIVQESGPANSLGLVKFDMRNDHAIYLHDTPAKALFQSADRHRSHGCVRVSDALGFARMIASDQGVAAQWEQARAKDEESFVALKREIPVRLLYHSAFLDGERVVIRDDAYGWDDAVAAALGHAQRARRLPRARAASDIGP